MLLLLLLRELPRTSTAVRLSPHTQITSGLVWFWDMTWASTSTPSPTSTPTPKSNSLAKPLELELECRQLEGQDLWLGCRVANFSWSFNQL